METIPFGPSPCDMLKKLPLIRRWFSDRFLARSATISFHSIIADTIWIY
jgi:hypothetical protein